MLPSLKGRRPPNRSEPIVNPTPPKRGVKRVSERLPKSAPARIALGIGLILGGLFGFLPILGFWMIPLGLAVLAIDIPPLRRYRRRLLVKLEKRRRDKKNADGTPPKPDSSDPR